MTKYADLGDFQEDQRIATIGRAVMRGKKVVGFFTDDVPGKPERYIRKLQERFPGIQILEQCKGSVPDTVFVKVGPPAEGAT